MDRIEFRRVNESHSGLRNSLETLHPVVNGHLLRDLAGVVERSVASRADRKLAGSYWALSCGDVAWPSRHFLDDGDAILLGCECGEAGCWPLIARIAIEPGLVTWSHFRNGHRDWDLSDLGPFRFAHARYLAALRESAQR